MDAEESARQNQPYDKRTWQCNHAKANIAKAADIYSALDETTKARLKTSAERICQLRKGLCEMYRRTFSATCRVCGGRCCSGQVTLNVCEILVPLALCGAFELPVLDAHYFTRHTNQPCMFLSKNGCALEHWRPRVCLGYRCELLVKAAEAAETATMDNIIKEIENEMQEFYRLANWPFSG